MKFLGIEKTDTHRIYHFAGIRIKVKLKNILKIDEIKQTLTANKIKYYTNPDLRWRSMNPCKKLNLSKNGIIDKFNNCCVKCVQIYKNQMHICPISTFCEVQGFVKFDAEEGYEYALLDSNLPKSKLKRDLVNFYSRNLFNPCDWCPEVKKFDILPAEQI